MKLASAIIQDAEVNRTGRGIWLLHVELC